MTYLGMQVLIEGLALAAFQRIRDTAKNNLAGAVNAYVMQDEARTSPSAAWRCANTIRTSPTPSAPSVRSSSSRRSTSCANASTRARSGCGPACR